MTSPHSAFIRKAKERRAAMRTALRHAHANVDLTPDQLKLVMHEHDELTNKLRTLDHEHSQAFARINGASEDRVFATAGRRMDEIDQQAISVRARADKLRAHPQVHAAILAREAKEALS
jgi:hypothetical protein